MHKVRRAAAGDGKLGCILWTALLAVLVFIAFKAIPVKVAASELYDYMDEQARFASRASPEALQKRILDKAKELELPVLRKNVKVERRGGTVQMRVTFTVPLEFPGYTYYWDFDLRVDRKVFLF